MRLIFANIHCFNRISLCFICSYPPKGQWCCTALHIKTCELVDEYRPGCGCNPFDSGFDITLSAARFADEVKTYLTDLGVHDKAPTVAVEQAPVDMFHALQARGIHVVNADVLVERARSIKSADEIQCMHYSIAVAEQAMIEMRDAMQPGITENQLWSVLNQVNIAHDGDWTEGSHAGIGTAHQSLAATGYGSSDSRWRVSRFRY